MVLPTAVDVMVKCASPHMSVAIRAGVGAIATPLVASTPRKMVRPATPRPPASITVATNSISSRPLAQASSLLVLRLRVREGAGATGIGMARVEESPQGLFAGPGGIAKGFIVQGRG